MLLEAYKYDGKRNVVKKTLKNAVVLNYNYSAATDLRNPEIRITTPEEQGLVMFDYNYIIVNQDSTAADFGSRKRCYFVSPSRVRSVARGIWLVGLELDVLTTYKDEISASTANIARSSSRYNLYLNDTFYNAYAYPRVGVKEFPRGFSNAHTYLLSVCNNLGLETQSEEGDR